MILLGCLLAFSRRLAPRLVLILAWIFSDRWDRLAGRLPAGRCWASSSCPTPRSCTCSPGTPAVGGGGNIEGWDWMWIILGLFLDLGKWSLMFANRKEAAKQPRSTTRPVHRAHLPARAARQRPSQRQRPAPK